MNIEHIETYSDRIPNEWVKYSRAQNCYFLRKIFFEEKNKSLKPVEFIEQFHNEFDVCQRIMFMIGIGDYPQYGIITEQLTAILIHRQEEFNKKLPSEQGTKIVELLKEVVRLTEERIEDRKNRGVHGENKL